MRLTDATVVVTGGSSGIGAATAVAARSRGAHLTLVGRDENRLARCADRVHGTYVVTDLSEPHAVAALGRTLAREGGPDVIVHNAGFGLLSRAVDCAAEQVEELFTVNVFSPMELCRALVPAMVDRGRGHLVFLTSIAGALGVADESAYAASKAALGAYAASLRAELAGTGVGVTCVVPAAVDTEFFTRRGVAYGRRIPRAVEPERVAARVVRGIEQDQPEIVVPSWLRLAIATRACTPRLYARLADRWG